MTRITAPRATTGNAPSHSPPDTLYAPGNTLARGLGWFSIGLGLAEILAPRAMAELTGTRLRPELVQAFGAREIASGIGILGSTRPTGWMWTRVAGDALDLAALCSSLDGANDGQRKRVLASIAAVVGVTALDILSSTQLSAAAALEG